METMETMQPEEVSKNQTDLIRELNKPLREIKSPRERKRDRKARNVICAASYVLPYDTVIDTFYALNFSQQPIRVRAGDTVSLHITPRGK